MDIRSWSLNRVSFCFELDWWLSDGNFSDQLSCAAPTGLTPSKLPTPGRSLNVQQSCKKGEGWFNASLSRLSRWHWSIRSWTWHYWQSQRWWSFTQNQDQNTAIIRNKETIKVLWGSSVWQMIDRQSEVVSWYFVKLNQISHASHVTTSYRGHVPRAQIFLIK